MALHEIIHACCYDYMYNCIITHSVKLAAQFSFELYPEIVALNI